MCIKCFVGRDLFVDSLNDLDELEKVLDEWEKEWKANGGFLDPSETTEEILVSEELLRKMNEEDCDECKGGACKGCDCDSKENTKKSNYCQCGGSQQKEKNWAGGVEFYVCKRCKKEVLN